jgi:hypothetical protein
MRSGRVLETPDRHLPQRTERTGVMTETIPITKRLSGIPPAGPVHSRNHRRMPCRNFPDVQS